MEGDGKKWSDLSTRGSDPETGLLAPADPRNVIQGICPEERSPRNGNDTAQDPQGPSPLVDLGLVDPSLKDIDRPPGELGYIYIYSSMSSQRTQLAGVSVTLKHQSDVSAYIIVISVMVSLVSTEDGTGVNEGPTFLSSSDFVGISSILSPVV